MLKNNDELQCLFEYTTYNVIDFLLSLYKHIESELLELISNLVSKISLYFHKPKIFLGKSIMYDYIYQSCLLILLKNFSFYVFFFGCFILVVGYVFI